MENEMKLHHLVAKAANEHATKLAVTYDDGHLQSSLTYSQMWNLTDKVHV